jgi:hypothetical protein
MSTLLEQASLVMIPSGYKEDVVYSQIPINGSGDMAFTRASNGTRINSAGLVEVCPWNMLSNSEQFTSANGWFASITGGSTATQTSDYGVAPNGTTTADRIQLALNGQPYADWVSFPTLPIVVGQVYTYSIYMKSLSGTPTIYFFYDGVSSINKTLTTDWVRYEHTFTATNTSIYPRFLLQAGSSSSADLLAWGYQLNIGATAKPYFPTTDRLNVPRLTYQNGGGGCPSLLLEKQSTNVLLNSEDLNSWLKLDTSVTSNSTTSPDGTQNADTVTATGSGSLQHLIYQNLAFTSGTAYTMSVFAKANTSNFIQLVFAGDFINNNYANFNLSNGTITASAFVTAKIENYGNGWYRCSISATAGASNTNSQIIYLINSGTASRAQSFTANGESVYLWGGQFEAGSYATSLINTTSSSATRVADACFKTGISSLIGQTEGTALLDFQFNGQAESIIMDIAASGLSPQNRIILYQPSATIVQFIVLDNNVEQVNIASSSYSVGQRLKVGIAYKSNDFAFYINGVQIGTDSSGSVPATSRIDIGNRQDVAYPASITVNEFYLSKTRLTNAELASLTTI